MKLNAQYYQGVLTLTHPIPIGHNWEIQREDNSSEYVLYEIPEYGGKPQFVISDSDLNVVLKKALSLT